MNKQNILFSIIIPVYNVAPYLRECLDSVLAQTFIDWEAICVDDGSTDGSGAILDEYATKDSRFRVLHQPNAGVSSARNRALKMASGDWILFLDGDDIWHSRLLATVEVMIEKHPDEKLFRFGFEKFESSWHKDIICNELKDSAVIDISKEITMSDFYDYYFVCYVYQKGLLDGIVFPNYIRGEDRCVLNRIQLERVNHIVTTDAPLYGYRQRSGSAMSSIPSRKVLCDEMDHRLDIMEMIDASGKEVNYAGSGWLEKYFTQGFYRIITRKAEERKECYFDWQGRLHRLSKVRGLSITGRWVVKSCLLTKSYLWAALVCHVLPRLANGGSPSRWLRRKLGVMVARRHG